MKTTIKSLIAVAFASAMFSSCDTIENSYDFNQKNPISAEELKAALEFTQLENKDGDVVGDQYIIVRNKRPDIGGAWHLVHNGNETTYNTDNDTIVCTDNGEFELYYQGISNNTVVRTEPFTFTVTNVFDDWSNYFTGAENKADKTASKTWVFRGVKAGDKYRITLNGAYGAWKYGDGSASGIDAIIASNSWWSDHTIEEAADYKMVFNYENNKLIVSDATGATKYEGTFSFTHNHPDSGVIGELITDVPLIGGQWDDCMAQRNGSKNVFWIMCFDGENLTICHPDSYSGAEDWDNCAWFAFYQVKK